MPARTDVFLSYSREDAEFARQLRLAMMNEGLSVWIDESSIPMGVPFWASIQAGIEGASAIVSILTPEFCGSRFCRLETEHAVLRAKRFVPVRRSEVAAGDLHPALAEINWVDFPSSRAFTEGAADCVRAVKFDLAWATQGTIFLQRALDWSQKRGDLLGRDGVRDLSIWIQEAVRRSESVNQTVRTYLEASKRALRQARRRRWSIAGFLFVLLVGGPLYVMATTPAAAWMATGVDGLDCSAVAVTRGADGQDLIWARVGLGEVHHPNPYEAEDDVFESKEAVYELSQDGDLRDQVSIFQELYASSPKWLVGDFEFEAPARPSPLTMELRKRFEQLPGEVLADTPLSPWPHLAPVSNGGTLIHSIGGDWELNKDVSLSPQKHPLWLKLATLVQKTLMPGNGETEEYPERLTHVKVFGFPAGFWLAFAQVVDFGKRYDVGVLCARSEDGGQTWKPGMWIPRSPDAGDFFFNVFGINEIAAGREGSLMLSSSYNLSSDLGHPSGARGLLATSIDGGLTWSEVELPSPLDSYQSFTGVAIDSNDAARMALSVEDRNGTAARPGPAVWLTEDEGKTWRLIEEGLNLGAGSRVSVLWVAAGPRMIATVESGDHVLRPLVFRPLHKLERLRGKVGVVRAERP